MNSPTAYHQLGRFIVAFQHIEGAVNDLLELMADTDGEVVRILANDLEYSKRLNTADVLFARFVDLRKNTNQEAKADFHKLVVELRDLGERRNEFVHSQYNPWIDVHGKEGLLRANSKLRGNKGEREEKEEELQPDAFNRDLVRLTAAAARLEAFRLQVIDWLYPSDDA
jgi:parvulin-like peptidyl-prolyl isomerase